MHEAGGAIFEVAGVIGGIPVLHDLNGPKSITNAAEEVIRALHEILQPRSPIAAVIYRDTYGNFDALAVTAETYSGFILLSSKSYEEAFDRLTSVLRKMRGAGQRRSGYLRRNRK